MKKLKGKAWNQLSVNAAIFVAGIIVAGGSFALASGSIAGSNSMLAAVFASLTGRPVILIGRDGASPSGQIGVGPSQSLAVFDIAAKNVTHWATLYHLPVLATVTVYPVSPLTLNNFMMKYTFCIPTGKHYGYGWTGGGCQTLNFIPTSVTQSGNSYILSFDQSVPVYPESSYAALTIIGSPHYANTNGLTKAGSGNARLQVQLTGGTASGDQCNRIRYGYTIGGHLVYTYGYSGCVSKSALVTIQLGVGNTLTFVRPYGYGYAGALKTTTTTTTTTTPTSAQRPPVQTHL